LAAAAVVVSFCTYLASSAANDINFEANKRASDLTLQEQVNSRFDDAGKQLDDMKDTAAMIDAVDALQDIADHSIEKRPQVIEILASFIRRHAPLSACATNTGGITDETSAALIVIARENHWSAKSTDYTADLDQTCLAGAKLAGLNMSGMNLIEADLTQADLTRTNLTDSNLFRAKLNGVMSFSANFYCSVSTVLQAPDAWLINANFTGADLIGANMYHANLVGANFTDTVRDDMDTTGAELDEALLPSSHSGKLCERTFQYQEALMR
jgi:hypothetical protein